MSVWRLQQEASPARVDIDPHRRWPIASLVKLPLAIVVGHAAAVGEISLRERVRIEAHGRTPGPTGTSVLRDPVEVSVRDALFLALAYSDNAAADTVWDHLGTTRVHQLARELSLPQSMLRHPVRQLYADLATDLGTDDDRETIATLRELNDASLLSVLDPERVNAASPAEMSALITRLWRDEISSPAACDEVRSALRRTMTPSRIGRGFPYGVGVAAKTGTLLGLRHEAGVITLSDSERYVVSAFTSGSHHGDPTAQEVLLADSVHGAVIALRNR